MDPMDTDDPTAPDHTDSFIYEYSEQSSYDDNEKSGSGVSVDIPPSSGRSSQVDSGLTSDSDLPPPPSLSLFKSSKPVHQTGLRSFFSVIPADEAHAVWKEKKRKNRDRDEEEHAEVMCQEKSGNRRSLRFDKSKITTLSRGGTRK